MISVQPFDFDEGVLLRLLRLTPKWPGGPTPMPNKNEIRIDAPAYTKAIFPQSMAFHPSTFQYICHPTALTL